MKLDSNFKALLLTGIALFWGCGLPEGLGPSPPFFSIVVAPTPVSGTAYLPVNPQVAADSNGNVFVVWQDYYGISYTYSAANSNSFSLPFQVPGSPGGKYPRISTDGSGNLFVAWFDPNGSPPAVKFNYAVNYNTFLNAARTVSTASVPFPDPGTPPPLDINVASGRLALAWSQCILLVSPCADYEVFATSVAISVTTPPIIPNTFPTPGNISGTNTGFALYPKIRQYNGKSYIQFFGTPGVTTDLYLSIGNAAPFAIDLSGNSPNSSLDIDASGNVYSAWNPNQVPSNVDVFFSFLPTTGTVFSTPFNVTNNKYSFGPALAIDSSSFANLAFFSFPAGQSVNDIYLTRSTDGGVTFPSFYNLSMSPNGTSASYAPGFAIVDKTAYLVWDDNPAAVSQIYFEKLNLK